MEDEEMAANDKIVRSSPPQNKAGASAKVLPPMNQSSIELNDNEDEGRVDGQSEANHCPLTNQVSSAV